MAKTYTLWRSVQHDSRFPTPIAVGLTAQDAAEYVDTDVLPGVRYYYKATESGDGQTANSNEASAVAPALPPVTSPKDTMSTRIFSTGTLFADTGAGPVEFAALQEISWDVPFQEKELRTAPWLNEFAEARAFFGAKMTLKAKSATVRAKALAILTGGTATDAAAAQGGTPAVPARLRVGQTAILPRFSGVFTTQDEDGNPLTLTCGRIHAPGMVIPFKLEDFAFPDFTMEADTDENGDVGIWQYAV